MGVLARSDPGKGVAMLADAVSGDDARTASIAARVLGFCGVGAEHVTAVVTARLPQEQRKGVANALALAAGDAGATAAGPLSRERLASGIAAGKQWQQWLKKTGSKVAWRDGPQDVEDLRYWY